MKNALDDINAAFTAKTGVKVVASYAASSALAKQIEQGAPAECSSRPTSTGWITRSQKKLIKEPTPRQSARQQLVLIAPKDSKIGNVTIGQGFDLAKLAGDGRIATGDVRVGAGRQIRQGGAGEARRLEAAEPKFAMAENVRAALTLVARGEAPLGIVYETDAKVEPGVKIVGAFPADSHPPIIYPVAATATAKPEAADYLAFLRSTAAKTIFEKYGFTFLVKPVRPDRVLEISRPTNGPRSGCRCASPWWRRWWRCRSASRIAWLLARKDFWGKALLDGIVHLPLVLPPVVTGYLLLI